MSQTIDYANRGDLVKALLDFRKQGINVDVVHNGRTLRLRDDTPLLAAAGEEEEPDGLEGLEALKKDGEESEGDSLLGVVQPSPAQEPSEESGATPSGPGSSEEGDEAEPVEGTCSVCEEAALQEQDGTWVHAGDDTHPDNPGEFVANTSADDEDLIGAPVTPTPVPTKAAKRTRNSRQS